MQGIIQTPTPNLEVSLDFYKRLNFTILSEANPTVVTDGKVIIEINPDRFTRAGIKFYGNDLNVVVEKIQQQTAVTKIENGHLFNDPSGTRIQLVEGEWDFSYDLNDMTPSTLGNYAGMSLETTDIHKSIAIYEILGFEKTMGGIDQGWVAYQNKEEMGVSFMLPNSCPHLFFNPSMTYFNGKNNLNIIEKIRAANISITEEITVFNKEGIVDNVIIRDPGGYGFFIFND